MKKILAAALALLICMSLFPSAYAADKGYEVENETVQVYSRSFGGSAVQVYFELHNTGSNALYCQSGTAELEDTTGHLIGTSKSVSVSPEVILPGETAYYSDVIYLDENIDYIPGLYVKPKTKEATISQVLLDVSDVSFSQDSLGILNAVGRVKNNTGEDLDGLIDVALLLYDKDGQFLGKMYTFLTDDLEDGDRTSFELSGLMLPGKISPEDIDSFFAFSWPQQFQF